MTYILSAQRDPGGPAALELWQKYERYVRENKARFPSGAYALASSDWYFGFTDHRAPHDAWLEWVKFEEHATGERNEVRHLSLRVRLLGAYHDMHLEYFYPKVFAYSLNNNTSSRGHSDWRYDELRLAPNGNLLHEIEWAGAPGFEAHWLIEASDVEFSVLPREEV
jgi:hypothetical protein